MPTQNTNFPKHPSGDELFQREGDYMLRAGHDKPDTTNYGIKGEIMNHVRHTEARSQHQLEEHGFTEADETRMSIIEEAAEMRRVAEETGGERHLPAIDNIEAMALDATDENFKGGQ